MRQRDRLQMVEYFRIQTGPQVVGQALLVITAVFLAAALRRVDRLLHSHADVGDRQLFAGPRQKITAARAAHAFDQRTAPQLAEQLLEIRERDLLPRAYVGERYRPLSAAHC